MKRRKKTISRIAAAFLVMMAMLTIYSYFIEPGLIVSEEREFTFKSLPKSFDGYTIALMSDLHYSDKSSGELIKEALDLVNEMNPDIILIAGDFVTKSKENIAPMVELLKRLKSKRGIFAVLGNHDNSVSSESVSSALKSIGITVLANGHRRINIDDQYIYLIGIDDIYWGAGNLKKAVVGMKYPDSFKILLSHIPDAAFEADALGIDLVLAGHTHGGQIKLPFYKSIIKGTFIFSDLIEGRYDLDNTVLYVSRGVGTVGMRARFLSRPEVTKITLRRGK